MGARRQYFLTSCLQESDPTSSAASSCCFVVVINGCCTLGQTTLVLLLPQFREYLCPNRLSFYSNDCLLHQLKLIYFKLYLELYCGNILTQRKSATKGGEHWASLVPSGAACAQAIGREMFLFWFCNLTIVAGRVGVPCSESKAKCPGTESKWIFFFF